MQNGWGMTYILHTTTYLPPLHPINGLRALLTQIQNTDTEYSKAAMANPKGKKAFQNVLEHYNAIAQWLGFPPLLQKK